MYSGPLCKSCKPCPWGLLLRNHKAQSFHSLFVAMYSGPLCNYCQPCPWVHTGPAPGASWEKLYNFFFLRNHMVQSFHMLCGRMYNTLLYKCCQRCPWDPYRPHPRHVIIYYRLIMEIYEKYENENMRNVELYINSANLAPGVKYGPTAGVIIGP